MYIYVRQFNIYILESKGKIIERMNYLNKLFIQYKYINDIVYIKIVIYISLI